MSFDKKCWTRAEATIMAKLCKLTGSTLATNTKPGNAFIGFLPALPNSWAFDANGLASQAATQFVDAPPTTVSMAVEIEGYFTERVAGQEFLMSLISEGELRNTDASGNEIVDMGNVVLFRVREGGEFACRLEKVTYLKTEIEVDVWTVKAGCEIVFTTGA